MTFNLIIAGVGGQGTVLASKLIAAAAMKKGFDVRTAETIGMAQRGGSVFGHIRIGENIFSPLVPLGKADALIAFEPSEAVRQLAYLSRDGAVITCDSAVQPGGMSGSYETSVMMDYLKEKTLKLFLADGAKLKEQNAKTLNVCLLGAAAQCGIFPFDAGTLRETLTEVLPRSFHEMNLKAFELGIKLFNENKY